MSGFDWLRKLLNNERGNVIMIGAATMPLLIGSAALAIDTIQLGLLKRQLQRKADSAAIAGAHAVAQDKPSRDSVLRDLQINNFVALSAPAVVHNAPMTGRYIGNQTAVEVVLTSRSSLPFMAFFMGTAPIITARSVAAKVGGDNHCLLALDTDEKNAVELTGNATVDLGCGIASNSNHAQAARLTGNLKLKATGLTTVGGIEVSGNATFPANARHAFADPQVDPFGPERRNLQVPNSPSTCTANKLDINDAKVTLQPGRYCGSLSINGKSNVTFSPGTYIVDGEFFKINGSATVRGDGVTFVLTGQGDKFATLDWNGDANINFSAPKVSSNSPYAGVLVMGDPRMPESVKHFLNGNLKLSMRGAMYFPTSQFFWNGNTSVDTRCLQIVARTININGNPNIPNQCTEDDGAASFVTVKVRLVE